MNGLRKDLREIEELKERLRRLLRKNGNEFQSLETMLRQTERRIEDNLAKLDSLQTEREKLGKRFRKRVPASALNPSIWRDPEPLRGSTAVKVGPEAAPAGNSQPREKLGTIRAQD